MPSKTNFADKFFVVGGTLGGNVASYVRRPLDDDLLQLTLAGEYCNVLAARQMGKSSLMVRTAQKLREAGVKVAIIDLTAIGSSVSASEWYFGLLSRLVRELKIEMDEQSWWQAMEAKSPVQRFSDFLRDVILETVKEPVVVFIDEIDSTLKLDFTDDFFAAIRAAYNARSRDEAYKRLTFVLLGVARPGDLIKDRTRTPYNIGVNVDVTDFQLNELDAFRAVLDEYFPKQGREVLQWVLNWTGGQPYLTQKLCAEVADADGTSISKSTVDELVETIFLSDQARTETNLRAIRDRIQNSPYLMEMLDVYKRVLAGKRIAAEERSIAQNELKLTGLLRVSPQGILQVRNNIYEHIFDLNWAKSSVPANVTNRRLIAAISGIASIAIAVAGFLYLRQANQAIEAQAQTYVDTFNTSSSQEVRISNLAGLFGLGGDYKKQALELFQSLSYQDQLALFDLTTPQNVGNELVVVVGGVYQSISNTSDGNALLLAMANALGGTEAAGAAGLAFEITDWVDGRQALAQGQYEAAVDFLSEVIKRSEDREKPNLPALLERAQAYIRLEQYDSALRDLDRVIELDDTRASEVNGIILREGNDALIDYLREHSGVYLNIENAISVPTSTPTEEPASESVPLPDKIVSEGTEMVLVPAGEFIMGMDAKDAFENCKKYSVYCDGASGFEEQSPEHIVYLDSYYIDKYEVTNLQYGDCVKTGECDPPRMNSSYSRASYFDNPDFAEYPIIHMSWSSASRYCQWRGAKLPTEAQWEKAARGTDGRLYPWGNEFDTTYARSGPGDTAEVGSYSKGVSPYDAYDLMGNVWEWVADWYQEDYYSFSPFDNPLGPTSGTLHSVRGGSWYSGGGEYTAAHRGAVVPYNTFEFGFRCAMDAP